MASDGVHLTLGPGAQPPHVVAAPQSLGGGSGDVLGPAARLVGKGLGGVVAVKQHMWTKGQAAASAASAVASEAADKVDAHMTDEQKESLAKLTGAAKEKAQSLAVRGGEVGAVAVVAAKDGYDEAQRRVAAARQAAFDALSEEDQKLLREARKRYDEKREAVKDQVMDFAAPHAWKIVELLKPVMVNFVTADPDMWSSAKRTARWTVDNVFDDVREEATSALQGMVLKEAVDKEPKPVRCCLNPARFRAFVLYHMYPCDRSIFGKLRDVWYYLLNLPALFPYFCVREAYFAFILILQLLAMPPDEFQLCNFILQFKAMQFISGGFLVSMLALLRRFLCTWGATWGHVFCEDPEGIFIGAAQFFASALLVWMAFLSLPFSKKYGQPRFIAHAAGETSARQLRLEEPEKSIGCCCCTIKISEDRGGRLAGLLKWDMGCCVLACVIFVALFAVGYAGISSNDPEARHKTLEVAADALTIARCIYCFLTFPFFVFVIPGLSRLLTHTRTTGFDKFGRCVPFELPAVEVDPESRNLKNELR